MQAAVRGMLIRQRLRVQAEAALIIQTNWRRIRERHKYNQIYAAVIAIQAAYRGNEARTRFVNLIFNNFHLFLLFKKLN